MVTKSESPKPKTKTSPKTTVKSATSAPEFPSDKLEEIKTSLKNELRSYVDERLDDRLLDKIESTNKKLLREKTRKIWTRNILILILLALAGFEAYALFQRGFFDSLLNHSASLQNPTVVETATPSSEPSAPSLDELKAKYASLLNNFKIPKDSAYYSDYKSGNLSNELKLYLSLNALDFGALPVEEDYNLVSTSALTSSAKTLFENSDLRFSSFEYNGNRLRFFEQLGSFVSAEVLKKAADSNLETPEISDIKEDGETVTIKTSEGLNFTFKNRKLSAFSKN